jgi:hypothetical protein
MEAKLRKILAFYSCARALACRLKHSDAREAVKTSQAHVGVRENNSNCESKMCRALVHDG